MYEKDICGFSFVNYRDGNDLYIQNYMGGLGGEAPQPPEAKNFQNKIKTPLNKGLFEGRWGGVYSTSEGNLFLWIFGWGGGGTKLNALLINPLVPKWDTT